MKDLYKRLKIDESAPDTVIRQSLEGADPESRSAAEYVLLDARRRAVYDRNRGLLLTIGQLRGHLGLSYTRFWARREFKDFWQDLAPPAANRPGRRVDPAMIARAFHSASRHGRRHAARWGPWVMAAILLVMAGIAVLLIRWLR